VTWLGYCNSFFNPCVYAFLNRDFRSAFGRVLCCGSKAIGRDAAPTALALTDHRSTATKFYRADVETVATPAAVDRHNDDVQFEITQLANNVDCIITDTQSPAVPGDTVDKLINPDYITDDIEDDNNSIVVVS